MHEPNGVVGVVLLATASLLSVAMGAVPKLLSREAMSQWYFVWSVVGVMLPLFVVFGCAVSRPSAIGNDATLYPLLGAFVRSYCFASSRWQAVVVPAMTAVGLLQYLLPGGLIRYGLFFVIIFVIMVVVSEREREGAHRENARQKVERKLLLAQSRMEETLRDGLLKNTLPPSVLRVVKMGQRTGGGKWSHVNVTEGVTMVVRSLLGSSSAKRFEPLDGLLAKHSEILSLSGLLGDQAVVVGPVPRGFSPTDRPSEKEISAAVKAATLVGTKLVGDDGLATSTRSALRSPTSPTDPKPAFSATGSAFSVVMDVDDVVHSLEVNDFAQYWALGSSVTRMMAITQGVDATALFGCLATDRLVKHAKEFGAVSETNVKGLGPIRVRGAGIVRLSRLEAVGFSL